MKPRASSIGAHQLVLLLFCLIATLASCQDINKDIVIKNAEQTIDLVSQVTKITTRLTLENKGKTGIKKFVYAIGPPHKPHFSYISASLREHNRPELEVKEVPQVGTKNNDKAFFEIILRDQLQPERSVTVEVETVFTHMVHPFPKEITQKEKQLVKYTGNLYIFSPYPILKQSTNVLLPSRNIESYTKIKPVEQSDSTISYGPFENKGPYAYEEVNVHYENNNKFLTVTKLERTIEVSHWGNIAVEETVDLLHTGAALKGSFSRYEFARESKTSHPCVQSFDTLLPASAVDIYYRDDIGNISTSHTKYKRDSVELNLRPRFPLFGGWKTRYTIGYNVPSYEYLYNSGDEYILKIRLIDHIYDDMVIDEADIKFILPEGSKYISAKYPYKLEKVSEGLHYTYLDTTGRPVIKFSKQDIVENHIQDIEIRYKFPKILMVQEPLLVSAALYLLFLLVIVYVRLDFSIDRDEISESKLRVAGQCEKILAAQDRRVGAYNELDELLANLKTNKDVNSYLAQVKAVNQEYKNATASVSELAQKLKGESGDVYDRVQELQKNDRALKELYNQQQSMYVDKLVPGKIGRQQFVEAESAIAKKKEEIVEKINSIVKSLQ